MLQTMPYSTSKKETPLELRLGCSCGNWCCYNTARLTHARAPQARRSAVRLRLRLRLVRSRGASPLPAARCASPRRGIACTPTSDLSHNYNHM